MVLKNVSPAPLVRSVPGAVALALAAIGTPMMNAIEARIAPMRVRIRRTSETFSTVAGAVRVCISFTLSERIAYRPFTGNAILAMAIVPPVTKPVATHVNNSAKSVIDISCLFTVCSTSDALCNEINSKDESCNNKDPSRDHGSEVYPVTVHRLEPKRKPTRTEISRASIAPHATTHSAIRLRSCAICSSSCVGSAVIV